jgi:hypothetical protein
VTYGNVAAHYLEGVLKSTVTNSNLGVVYAIEDLEYRSRVGGSFAVGGKRNDY